jgi:hypothetical protein
MKFSLIFLLALGMLASCQKSNTEPGAMEVTGQLKYSGDPNSDGRGYYLVTDSTHENLNLQNLPVEFKHTDVNTHVAINFFDTGRTLVIESLPGVTGPRIVVVKSIRRL